MLTRFFRKYVDGTERCFYVETSSPLAAADLAKLRWAIGETFEPEMTDTRSFFGGAVVEIGPRRSMETSFSSNAVAICAAMGIPGVTRFEQSTRYPVAPGIESAAILTRHLDLMTQEEYDRPLTEFGAGRSPEPVRTYPVLTEGAAAIARANAELGLGMDEWDVEFYTRLFAEMGRDPTDVELMQLGNANSEHSRHWFFRGRLVVDGVEAPHSLIDLIRAPLRALPARNATKVAFCDNAGVLHGFEVVVLAPVRPGQPSQMICVETGLDITCTAETHNHPTYIAPFPGAETGTGGRIRDQSAVGVGGLVVAGVAGYMVGNLWLPGHLIPGEQVGGEEIRGKATPWRVLIEGSNGVSDYGNKYGEPVIGGFTRTFGLKVAGERRESLKPVLYTGGVGRIRSIHTKKSPPEAGMLVVRIGGPAYRIGVGGGSASSMAAGTNDAALDFKSVQRGDAQMENRVNRAIRTCVELDEGNPIESIHDQGAGGPGNVLTELLEPEGGRLDIRRITLGDRSLSVLEIWVGEYQEGYGLLVRPDRIAEFQAICARERVNCEVVGEITGDGIVRVIDSSDGSTPVELDLEKILTGIPRKTFPLSRIPQSFSPFVVPRDQPLADLLRAVLRLPQVGSKGFLVRKVDRSVTGLIARQQCCGPAQIPVADVGVTADSHFGTTGAATALGEQPIKMLIDPAAGARMAVGEMLTNLAAANISDLGDVRCRVNWMWPAKLPGEGARLYDAAVAISTMMIDLGIAADGGKDSLSMSAKVDGETVKAPGQVVIMGYAPVPDIRRVMTPDFKHPGRSLIGFIDLGQGKNRLGGSSLAQALGQVGDTVPDVDASLLKDAFIVIQKLIAYGRITALHDRSDGGLATAVLEMCLAAQCGVEISLERLNPSDEIAALFCEELGFLFEYLPKDEQVIEELCSEDGLDVPFVRIGKTISAPVFVIWNQSGNGHPALFQAPISALRQWWEATSDQLELLQANPATVAAEVSTHAALAHPRYACSFDPTPTDSRLLRASGNPKVAILREEGTNGDREMAAACYAAGLEPWDITMGDLRAGRATLDDFQGAIFCGGFSFADALDSAKGWAGGILHDQRIQEMFSRFRDRPNTWSLGVCNGCQLMALLGWVPFRGVPVERQPRFIHNLSGRFESRWATVEIFESPAIMLQGMEGSRLGIWVAHGEGRLVFPDPSLLEDVGDGCLAPIAYVDPDGGPTEQYPYNPNGSPRGITALCSPSGRHLAMMPHPERCFLPWQWPWLPESFRGLPASPWLRMFQNARAWSIANWRE